MEIAVETITLPENNTLLNRTTESRRSKAKLNSHKLKTGQENVSGILSV